MTSIETEDCTSERSDDDVFGRRESEVRSYCRSFGVVFKSARGSMLVDTKGRTYIDFLAGCSSLNYGHNDPDMQQALLNHIKSESVTLGLDLFTTTKRDFMERFESTILEPRGLDYKVQFTGPTGTNAVEAAMKLARKVTGRSEIVAFTNGFHGVSLGALAATGNKYNRMSAHLTLGGVSRAFFDGYLGEDVDTIEILAKALDDPSSGIEAPAAFIVETVQGEGGLNVASAEWMRKLAALAKTHGSLLIVDDIQAGCGRTGTFFSFEEMGIQPDIVTMSKSISGFGLPMALVLLRPEIDVWSPAEHNGTFRGNGMAFATATVTLEKFWSDDQLTSDLRRRSYMVRTALSAIEMAVPSSKLKGRGMFQGIDVGSGELASAICRRAFLNGVVVEMAGPRDEVVKILAPLTTPDHLLVAGLERVLDAARSVIAEQPELLG
jgi:diaminobutyrate-2-oxoglutarate transaminase